MIEDAGTETDTDSDTECGHLDAIDANVEPHTQRGCEDCLKIGDRWVHLRLCLSCGHVGCCDNSKNKHATAHFRTVGHPLVSSFEPGEDWGWCYADEIFIEPAPGPRRLRKRP